jgi:hypothetical protein
MSLLLAAHVASDLNSLRFVPATPGGRWSPGEVGSQLAGPRSLPPLVPADPIRLVRCSRLQLHRTLHRTLVMRVCRAPCLQCSRTLWLRSGDPTKSLRSLAAPTSKNVRRGLRSNTRGCLPAWSERCTPTRAAPQGPQGRRVPRHAAEHSAAPGNLLGDLRNAAA